MNTITRMILSSCFKNWNVEYISTLKRMFAWMKIEWQMLLCWCVSISFRVSAFFSGNTVQLVLRLYIWCNDMNQLQQVSFGTKSYNLLFVHSRPKQPSDCVGGVINMLIISIYFLHRDVCWSVIHCAQFIGPIPNYFCPSFETYCFVIFIK